MRLPRDCGTQQRVNCVSAPETATPALELDSSMGNFVGYATALPFASNAAEAALKRNRKMADSLTSRFEQALIDLIEQYVDDGLTNADIRGVLDARRDDDHEYRDKAANDD